MTNELLIGTQIKKTDFEYGQNEKIIEVQKFF